MFRAIGTDERLTKDFFSGRKKSHLLQHLNFILNLQVAVQVQKEAAGALDLLVVKSQPPDRPNTHQAMKAFGVL